MLKYILSAAILLAGGQALAGDRAVTWVTEPNASGYRIQMSTDAGETWLDMVDAEQPPATISVPNEGLVLIRACSLFGGQPICRPDAGVWVRDDRKSGPVGTSTP